MKSRILIIDDEPMNLEYMVSIFEEMKGDFEIFQSNDGLHAYQVLEKSKPDLVITDWNMPNSGLDLVRRMRSSDEYATVPVIVYSGVMTSTDSVITALNAGATDYINKPINPMELIARSHSMLKLSQSHKREQLLNDSKDMLFNMVAHDLKNSVGGLQNILELLTNEEYEFDSLRKSEILSRAAGQAKKTYSLLDNLLNWARAQIGNLNAKLEEIQLDEVIDEVITEFIPDINNLNLKVKNTCHSDVLAKADRSMVEIITRNLIGNSIKFTPDGGHIKISAQNMRSDDKIKLIFSDNGRGISPKHLHDIINGNMFAQEYGVRGEKGNGIGLKLVQELLKLNNGDLEINSEVGKGTTVNIYLSAS